MAIAAGSTNVVQQRDLAANTAATASMQSQPWYQQQIAQWGYPATLSDAQRKQLLTLARQYGVVTGDKEIDESGQVRNNDHLKRVLLTDLAIGAGVAALPAVMGGAAASGTGATAGSTAATGGTTAATAAPVAAAPAATAGGAGAAGAGGAIVSTTPVAAGIWGKIAQAIPYVAPVVGALVSSHAAKGAAATQSAAADKSLALQKDIFERGQAGLSPYMSAGSGAVTNLRGLTGQPLEVVGPAAGTPSTMPANAAVAAPSTRTASDPGAVPTGETAVPRQTLQNFASAQTQSGYVTMRSPDGQSTQAVPANLVDHYRQQGATVVS